MSHSPRTAYFDNAKFLLMILVVFSHLLQPFIGDHKFYHDLYYFIFYLSYASLCFLAGYFAKPLTKGSKVRDLVKSFYFLMCFFNFLYSLLLGDWT